MENEALECQVSGRLNAIQELMFKRDFSLSIGSKETRFANINMDIDPSVSPDIIADARFLPFKNNIFRQVLFTDVIEHLPEDDEPRALKEIFGVLCTKGELILTTPNNCTLYAFLDPARYSSSHRHFSEKRIEKLLECCGFQTEKIFTAGSLWACISNLWYCFVMYPLQRAFHIKLHVPLFLQRSESKEYDAARPNGYTIFVKARKK